MVDGPTRVFGRRALAIATVLALIASRSAIGAPQPSNVTPSEVLLPGAPDHGIFDPSVATDGTGDVYLSISGVSSTPAGANVGDLAVSTYLAMSADQGKKWRLVGLVNPSVAVRLSAAPSPHLGRWQNEVSALVFDRYAPPAARWKLFWHQYLNVNGVRRFQHGWIAYKEASTPAELTTAASRKLITARAYDPVNNEKSGWTHPLIAGSALLAIANLSRDLSRCAAVTEPGVLAKPEGIYLSLVCIRGSPFGLLGFTNRVILLKCTRPCTAARSWSYVGTVLTQQDAAALGLHNKVSASDMFSAGGHDFITVSPVGTVPVPDSYNGCVVFRFADLSRAGILRDRNGRALIQTRLDLGAGSFNGACSYLPSKAEPGLLIGRLKIIRRAPLTDVTFHVYRSSITP